MRRTQSNQVLRKFTNLERFQRCLIELLQKIHANGRRNVVENSIYRFFGVVANDRGFGISQQLMIALHHLFLILQTKVNFHHLFQRFETPFSLMFSFKDEDL